MHIQQIIKIFGNHLYFTSKLLDNNLNLKKLKVLRVQFDTEIKPYEVPAFRGAIADKVGKENDMFHNHLGDEKLAYRYSLIQYKCIRSNPTILCLGEGVEEIHKFFEKRNWDIMIGDRAVEMKIGKLDLNQFTMQVWDKSFAYHIQNYIALNQEGYAEYQKLRSLTEQLSYLEIKLRNHIVNFAKGIDWEIDKEIEVRITALQHIKAVRYKQQKLMGFNFDFDTNVFLPNYIGLGGKVSSGFGVVNAIRH